MTVNDASTLQLFKELLVRTAQLLAIKEDLGLANFVDSWCRLQLLIREITTITEVMAPSSRNDLTSAMEKEDGPDTEGHGTI